MNLDSLTKKWHGLPVWAWAAISAVGLYLIYYLYKKRSGTTAATTPITGSVADNTVPLDNSGSGSSGSIPPPSQILPNEVIPANQPASSASGSVDTNQTPLPVAIAPDVLGPAATPTESPTILPVVGQTTSPTAPAKAATISASSLQSTVSTPNKAGVFPAAPTIYDIKRKVSNKPLPPFAVKATANKTGASANKTQGVFAIH